MKRLCVVRGCVVALEWRPETAYNSPVDVKLHPDLAWDYPDPPADPIWRLQRIADVFPSYGRDRHTVAQLFEQRGELTLRPETRALIELYETCWREHEEKRRAAEG